MQVLTKEETGIPIGEILNGRSTFNSHDRNGVFMGNWLLILLTTTIFFPLVSGMQGQSGVNQKGSAALTRPVCVDVQTMGGWWSYDWSPTPPDCPGIEMVPMVWGRPQLGTDIGGSSAYLLGFNEPDRPDQAAMTPDEAAQAWHDWIETSYPDRLLVSPAPTDPGWLREWRAAYIARYGVPPRLSAVAGHVYPRSLTEALATLDGFAHISREWGLPLWITEWAAVPCWMPGGSLSTALDLARQFANELDATPEVTRWAWFGSRFDGSEWWWLASWPMPDCSTSLFSTIDGQPTEWGQWALSRVVVQ
jgi:hypothetical protein